MLLYGSTSADAELVVLHGNCQLPYLASLLSAADQRPGGRGYLCVLNHAPPGQLPDAPSAAQMARCRLYLEQQDSSVDPPLRAEIRRALPPGCPTVVFPPVLLTSLWPFEIDEPAWRAVVDEKFPWGRFPSGDRIALMIAETGLSGDAAFDAYMTLSAEKMPNLERLLYHDLAAIERRDQASDVTIGDYVVANFRRYPMFWFKGHLALEAVGVLAERVYRAVQPTLGDPLVPGIDRMRAHLPALPPMGDIQLPIHPRVAEAFDLEFYDPAMRFLWMGQSWTFRDYIIRYIARDRSW